MHTHFRENLIRLIAVIGLIAVLLLGAWGIIQLAFFIPTLFDKAGEITAAKEELVLSTPSSVTSEHAFPVSWTHTGASGAFSYALSYSCADGLSFAAPLPNGTYQAVACNTPFNYLNATSSTPLVALTPGSQSAVTTLSLTSTELSSGSITKTATQKVTVMPGKAATTDTTPVKTPEKTTKTPTKTTTKAPAKSTAYQASGRTTNLYGAPDLTLRIVYAVPNYQTGRTTVEFVVENIGTNAAPAGWSFTATLPYQGSYPYNSGAQQMLYPGDKIAYTLGYQTDEQSYGYTNTVYPQACVSYNTPGCMGSGVGYGYTNYSGSYQTYQGGRTITIQADPYNQVFESNELNNTASATY
ncbi:hypothetical protein EXS62_01830 [Candidatus Kaiserbacteria bacterium]|nr:hypothetical protein [Candidatus Kaiserbacteria bacterium]